MLFKSKWAWWRSYKGDSDDFVVDVRSVMMLETRFESPAKMIPTFTQSAKLLIRLESLLESKSSCELAGRLHKLVAKLNSSFGGCGSLFRFFLKKFCFWILLMIPSSKLSIFHLGQEQSSRSLGPMLQSGQTSIQDVSPTLVTIFYQNWETQLTGHHHQVNTSWIMSSSHRTPECRMKLHQKRWVLPVCQFGQ